MDPYLTPTPIIDSDHNIITDYAKETTRHAGSDPVAMAVRLYYAVRDGIRYDPYSPFYLPEHYRASQVLLEGRGYCVAKATLLCALARACRIPSRIGFATVKNHLATRQLIAFIGSDRFVYHGFTEFYLAGRWIKASPAFNKELCHRFQVPALEFDGKGDSIFQAVNSENKPFMEYVAYHGSYDDVPVNVIVSAWKREYGKERVEKWIEAFDRSGGGSIRNFNTEDILEN